VTHRPWTDAEVRLAIEALRASTTVREACERISSSCRTIRPNALGHIFVNRALPAPSTYLREPDRRGEPGLDDDPGQVQVDQTDAADEVDDFRDLVRIVSRSPAGLSLEEIADALDVAPGKARALIQRAQDAGYRVDVVHGRIAMLPVPSTSGEIVTVSTEPARPGQVLRLAIISDTHFGHRCCMRRELVRFLEHAHEQGVRHVLHAGDFIDGAYQHSLHEQTHVGFDAQVADALEWLPRMPGMSYHIITGNHEQTIAEKTGVDVGRAIALAWRSAGRDDLHAYRSRDEYLRVYGLVVNLHHPSGGGAYALSYQLQNAIASYSHIKPHVLAMGHTHTYCHLHQRGVHGLLVPCWQGRQYDYGRSRKGRVTPTIGGIILSWTQTEDGTVRELTPALTTYYERERPVDVVTELPGSHRVDHGPPRVVDRYDDEEDNDA